MIADGGGRTAAALHPIDGAEQIARYIASLADRGFGLTLLERMVNGQPGLIAQQNGVTVTVFAFEAAHDRITRIWAVRNPDKLRPWTAGTRPCGARPVRGMLLGLGFWGPGGSAGRRGK